MTELAERIKAELHDDAMRLIMRLQPAKIISLLENSEAELAAKKLGYANYTAYGDSAHWKRFSKAVRAEACFVCAAITGLHVHHWTYDRLRTEKIDAVRMTWAEHDEAMKRETPNPYENGVWISGHWEEPPSPPNIEVEVIPIVPRRSDESLEDYIRRRLRGPRVVPMVPPEAEEKPDPVATLQSIPPAY